MTQSVKKATDKLALVIQFVQANDKENIKPRTIGLLWMESIDQCSVKILLYEETKW